MDKEAHADYQRNSDFVIILLFICLVALCLAVFVEGIVHRSRIYQFPFLASAVFLGFIVLSLWGLLRVDYLPDWGLERYIIMSILSMSAIWFGDRTARRKQVKVYKQTEYDPKRWLIGSAVLVFVGLAAYLKWRLLFQSDFMLTTGSTVAVTFFVCLLRYGFIMAMVHFLKTKNRFAMILIAVCAFYYFDRIALAGRRQTMIEFAFVIVASLWLIKRISVPRAWIVAGVILFVLLNFSTGVYRSIIVSRTGERDWSELREVDWLAGIKDISSERSSEITAGIYYMAGTANEMAFDYGLRHWNKLVFNYVPAQIVGTEMKESLYLPLPDISLLAEKHYGYTKKPGSTVTGMVDCFGSFWYFGAMKFFVIAYVMQLLYCYSRNGNTLALVLYLFMMTMALHTITHSTGWFVSPWIHITIFWLPVIYWSRKHFLKNG